jgi:hypothetical protein
VNEDPRRQFRHGKRLQSSFVGNGERLRVGTRRQLRMGNDMYRTHSEHECRSDAVNRLRMYMPFVWGRCRPNAIIR